MNQFYRPRLKLGIFDHLDDSGSDIAGHFANRLRIAEACDRARFHAYHVAEHHGTPHGLAPSPNLFLSAVAQRTGVLRLGPLVMLLNLYHPLRAFEEVCMLDQLSGGRVELGIGRGAVPLEAAFFGIKREEMQGRYEEASNILLEAMEGGPITHHGRYFDLEDVPLALRPVQKPHPPLWYGTTNPESAAWAAKRRMNVVTYGPASAIRGLSDAFHASWPGAAGAKPAMPMLGMVRQVVIADAEKAAFVTGTRAYARWYENLAELPRRSGLPVPPVPADFAAAVDLGLCFAGTASAVRDAILNQVEEAGVNYLLCQVAFGDLPVETALGTVAALGDMVLPALSAGSADRSRMSFAD
jgi:alkanesulfonate monooxygenase SsuD/methylene tetrahydromethanopterin reductase-like flavin-dependent oxidoreductase (luciferase family)